MPLDPTIINQTAAGLVTALIRLYQATISRLLPPLCRFRPSCSAYTIQALQEYGLLRGLLLGVRRVLRCHPFCPGGDDPLPQPKRTQDAANQNQL